VPEKGRLGEKEQEFNITCFYSKTATCHDEHHHHQVEEANMTRAHDKLRSTARWKLLSQFSSLASS
jgi:hypothetical protein